MQFTDDKETIGPKLKRYRLSREWTLEQMGRITGLTAGAISKIENGKVIPHDLTIAKLLRRLPGLLDDAA